MITPHGPIDAGEISEDIVIGDASGYKLARGSASVTGTEVGMATGLSTVVAVVASLGEDPNADAATVTAATGAAGVVDLKVWKLNEAAPNTLIASDVAKTVNWLAVGT